MKNFTRVIENLKKPGLFILIIFNEPHILSS